MADIKSLLGEQGGGAMSFIPRLKQSIETKLEERKENKQHRKDRELLISDEALKYLMKVYSLKGIIKNEDGIKKLFEIIQYMNKEEKKKLQN